MNTKATKIKQATNKLTSKKITLYHIISPINEAAANAIKEAKYFNPSVNALGGQSNGYYFFTTLQGATNHIDTMKDTWPNTPGNNAFLIECEVNENDIHYPEWMLDYEAMQDYLFDMILEAANRKTIKFNNLEISTNKNKTLNISENEKFSRLKSFSPNYHSGLVEKISDFLYQHDKVFKQQYDTLLRDVFLGNGNNKNLYAVKTKTKQKITKMSKIDTEQPIQVVQQSQINKFMSRYGKRRA